MDWFGCVLSFFLVDQSHLELVLSIRVCLLVLLVVQGRLEWVLRFGCVLSFCWSIKAAWHKCWGSAKSFHFVSWSRLPGMGAEEAEQSCCMSETVPQALTSFHRAWFIGWCLRHPFLGEYCRGLRHFWNCEVCLVFCLASDSQIKKILCHTLVW